MTNRQVIKKLLKDQQEVKINLNILSAGVKAQQQSETKKKLQALAVIVMDKTLKDEKDCETRLDQEVTARRSRRRFVHVRRFSVSAHAQPFNVFDVGRSQP